VEDEQAPKKRGRPKKIETEVITSFSQPVEIEKAAPASLQDPVDSVELWIDVVSSKGVDLVPVELWMQPALKAAAEMAGVLDWRLVDYNKGKGYLFAALSTLSPPRGKLLVRSKMAGAEEVIQFLTPYAKVIVRGLV